MSSVDGGPSSESTLPPDDPRHGTYNGYSNLKCRCDRCREANTAYCRAARERAAASARCPSCNGSAGVYAGGECRKCYNYRNRTGYSRPPHAAKGRWVRRKYPLCALPWCENQRDTRGWCAKHYALVLANGSPYRLTLRERFEAKTMRMPNGCIVWTGASSSGYGVVTIGGRARKAHRVSYRMAGGQIPPGYHIDHLCRETLCVNPDHLEPVTPWENSHRGIGNATTTRCPKGHKYEGANVYRHTDKRGYTRRSCRRCKRLQYLAQRQKAA